MNSVLPVGLTAVEIPVGSRRPVIINTGATTLYFGEDNTVSTANGIPLGPNVGYEFPEPFAVSNWEGLWVISDAAGGEVRYASVG